MKIDTKRLNLAFWLTIATAYFLPQSHADGVAHALGYPFPFLTLYDKPIQQPFFLSSSLNLMGLLFDALCIYLLLLLIHVTMQKAKALRKRVSEDMQ